jgi:hypothetical protein
MFDNLLKEDFKTQFKKFTEKEGIDKDTVQYYFKFFKRIKNKFPKAFEIEGLKTSIPIEKRKDIDAYQTFKDLENVVDYLRGQVDLGEGVLQERQGVYIIVIDSIKKNPPFTLF